LFRNGTSERPTEGKDMKGPRDLWGRSAGAPRSLLSLWVLHRRSPDGAGRMLGVRVAGVNFPS
jgi:hypothetical protein